MALYTTYLGFLQRHTNFHPSRVLPEGAELVYVMKGRGNKAIEPPAMVLRLLKEKAITWKGFKAAYLDSLNNCDSRMWMQRLVAPRCAEKNVVFVCYEKAEDKHCHRFLLAEVMAKDYGVQYLGELKA